MVLQIFVTVQSTTTLYYFLNNKNEIFFIYQINEKENQY